MRDELLILPFLLTAAVLTYLGRDLWVGSAVAGQALTFAAVTGGALLVLLLARVRRDLRDSRLQLARKEAELNFAREVQKALFPKTYPQGRGLAFHGVCIPAQFISGDYFDVLELPDGRQVFALADISGKGVSAAILMANLQALLRREARNGERPDELCWRLNNHFWEVSPPASFATFFYAEWDPVGRRLHYVNAGHNRPMLFSGDKVKRLCEGGLPLGIFPESRYNTGSVELQRGDLLLVYSDGVSEAGFSREEFGTARIRQAVGQAGSRDPVQVIERILSEVRRFAEDDQHDDMTLLAVSAVAVSPTEEETGQSRGERVLHENQR
ncbi:MAG TPA: PP2C family protein-serine/threonine phosphatase [Acidobacteriota bacterium]|nr:PP2C family protein-serine/threonine phosphatase [Acidobacteriota bacterium]